MGPLALQDNVSCYHLRDRQVMPGRFPHVVSTLPWLAAAFSQGLLATSDTKNLVPVYRLQHPHRCLLICQDLKEITKYCSLVVLLCVLKMCHFNQRRSQGFEFHSDGRDNRSKAIHHLASKDSLLYSAYHRTSVAPCHNGLCQRDCH